MRMSELTKVQEALCQFIVDVTKEKGPGNALQVLPETVKALVELSKITQTQR